MREKGQTNVTLGFSAPADGWHKVAAQEGINLKVNESSGKESLFIPMIIDEDGEDTGKKVALFINTRDENHSPYKSVEKQIANVLANFGLEEQFEKKFPGDVSYLDNRVIDAIKIKLPGCYAQVQTRTEKDSKGAQRVNIVALNIIGGAVPAPAGGAKPATKKAAATGDDGSDW